MLIQVTDSLSLHLISTKGGRVPNIETRLHFVEMKAAVAREILQSSDRFCEMKGRHVPFLPKQVFNTRFFFIAAVIFDTQREEPKCLNIKMS
jgi:hypothetical protein